MRWMRSVRPLASLLQALLPVLLLSACVSAPTRVATPPPFADARFKPLAQPIEVETIFAMTPAMRRYADEVLRPAMRFGHADRALVQALYDGGQLKLEYDAEHTRTAGSAFEARAGNCLSLVIMTGAFARHFGLPFRYQQVFTAPTWSRSGSLALANQHVNLALVRQSSESRVSTQGEGAQHESLTVDFMPTADNSRSRTRPVSEAVITAMFLNNRAAELLADGHVDDAYWWARKAIESVPSYTDSYNTLGVIYQKHGDLDRAEAVLRYALAQEPENTIPLSNLVGVLQARGLHAEAAQWSARLKQLEPFPPFHFYDLGLAALKAGQFEQARQFFQRELNREAHQPEAHFWIGIAKLYLNDSVGAQKHLARAIEHSTTQSSRALYTAKLDWLKSQGYTPRRGS